MALSFKHKDAVIITRTFDAPRENVWIAWTEPELLKRWWGPKKFTAPASTIDLRRGGTYLHCMRGPDGRDYWSTGTYREIKAPELLVASDSFADEKGNKVPASHYGIPGAWPDEQLVTVTLKDAGGKTRMTLTHEGIPAGPMRELCALGWNESFDKLAAHIVPDDRTKIIAEQGKQEVAITRVFDAPRDLVFKACTDRNLVPRWWGPERFATTIDKMDVKPGGLWRFTQRNADGDAYAFHGVYHKVAPGRIVSTFEFEGAPGHVSLDTIVLEEAGGRTKLVQKTVFQSVEDRDSMLREGMEEGVYESMDRLAVLLEYLKAERKAA